MYGFRSTEDGHFEKSPVLPLYHTELAMVHSLIVKSIKTFVIKCWFRRAPCMPTIWFVVAV